MTKKNTAKSLEKYIANLLFALVGLWLLYGYMQGKKLTKQHNLTTGVVNDCRIGGRVARGVKILYSYTIGEKTFTNTEGKMNFKSVPNELIGKRFPVIYISSFVGYDCTILMTPSDFATYGYAFPDSLQYVLAYLK